MSYLMIVLILSTWDGSVTGTKSIGYFDSYEECKREIERIDKVSHTRFLCVKAIATVKS